MNIISWNVRGLGRPAKRFLVRDFLLLHCAKVCCLQESKLEELPNAIWRDVGGHKLDNFTILRTRGSVGGIVVGWNSSFLIGKVLFTGSFCLTVEFCCKRDNLWWLCTSVYGPKAHSLKLALWEEIRSGCERGPSLGYLWRFQRYLLSQ
ncbi:DNase I-like protein [Dioscorea alata]|uniref:DNase I-like protein n=1 Tax=Dioscorea alata TaxID=55571 RepID=A0ACB7WDK6_DIOAL|nr:DNase I-like protein [Dioscorea alata]